MDRSKIDNEVESMLDAIEDEDAASKEYTQMISNINKLHSVSINQGDYELKERRASFDESLRMKQIELDEGKINFEREKWLQECEEKKFDRELESRKISNQHEEKMAELEINRLKAENEKKILEQNQINAEREYKNNRRRDWLIFGGKAWMLIMVIGVNIIMHKDELRFEREENGIVPQRCKTYDAVTNKMAEIVMK